MGMSRVLELGGISLCSTLAGADRSKSGWIASHPSLLKLPPWKLPPLLPCVSNRRNAQARCHDSSPSSEPSSRDDADLTALDRRQLLLLSSLGISGVPFYTEQQALGAPLQPPNLRNCHTSIDPGNGAPLLDCCLPVPTNVISFQFPTDLPMRVRRPAHLVSPDYAATYNRAYELLRQLPDDDPRSYTQQVNVHCAFCDAAYTEGGSQVEYQVHNSWLFFPWHRWYLYFHERILASLIDDESFALPFWNWDSEAGSTIPSVFIDNEALFDEDRSPIHQPPAVVDLNYNFTESGISPSDQLAANYATMYRQVVSNAKTPTLFFGRAYRHRQAVSPGGGTIEHVPHGTMHTWTGNPNNPNDENMGALYAASRDPLFYAHHSNVDRLWEVWKSLGGRREDISDPDWLNTTFVFYDENANLVRVKVRDALDTTKLRYSYEQVMNPWIDARPSPSRDGFKTMASGPGGRPAEASAVTKKKASKAREFKERKSKRVEGEVKALVKRPKKVKAGDFEEEVLVIEGVEIPTDQKVKMDVYINLPEGGGEERRGAAISEYAGSFYNLPHRGKHEEGRRRSDLRIGVGEVLAELGVEEEESFVVTIVPVHARDVPIFIQDIKLEYE